MAGALTKLFSEAPWMKYAWEEARKGVKEVAGTGRSKTNSDILKYLESVTNEIGRKSYLYIPVEAGEDGADVLADGVEPEEHDAVDSLFGDLGTDLEVAAERPGLLPFDVEVRRLRLDNAASDIGGP